MQEKGRLNSRNQVLDIAKGLLIFFVVLGHSIQFGFGVWYTRAELFYENILFRGIYTFHMPLFMLISGYLFGITSRKKAYKDILFSRLVSIGVPFVVYGFLLYWIWYFFHKTHGFHFLDLGWTIIKNMWFLSSILLNCIIVASVTYICKQSIWRDVILWFLFVLTFFISDRYISVIHKFMYFYFVVGFFFNQHSVKWPHWFWNKWSFAGLTVLSVICILFFRDTMFIYKGVFGIFEDGIIHYERLYTNILRFIIGLCVSCWVMRIIFYLYNHIKNLSLWIHLGGQTLAIYGFQCLIFSVVTEIMLAKNINIPIIPITYIIPLLFSVFVLFLCEGLIRVCNLNFYTRLMFLGQRKRY